MVNRASAAAPETLSLPAFLCGLFLSQVTMKTRDALALREKASLFTRQRSSRNPNRSFRATPSCSWIVQKKRGFCLMHGTPRSDPIHPRMPCRFSRARIGLFRKWRTDSVPSKKVMAREPTERGEVLSIMRREGGRVHGHAAGGHLIRKRTQRGPRGDITYSLLPTDRPPPPARTPIGIESRGSALPRVPSGDHSHELLS